MRLLQVVETKLKELDPNVYYGLADQQNEWNYIVFSRSDTQISENRTAKGKYIRVAVVRENFIEEGMEDLLLETMKSIPGLRKTQEPIAYTYMRKPNTNVVVEIMEAEFVKAVKRA